jgi:hypothetical protein
MAMGIGTIKHTLSLARLTVAALVLYQICLQAAEPINGDFENGLTGWKSLHAIPRQAP